jgi:uncharacterized SAM-binding protein YcdF (DUF218 family)
LGRCHSPSSVLSLAVFRERFSALTLDEVVRADAIVVLGGTLSFSNSRECLIQGRLDPDRFFGGIDLFKANKPRYLVFTGGKLPWSNYPSEGVIFRDRAINSEIDPTSIIITSDVTNTAQEAKAIGQLASDVGFQSIILVTSSNICIEHLACLKKRLARYFHIQLICFHMYMNGRYLKCFQPPLLLIKPRMRFANF